VNDDQYLEFSTGVPENFQLDHVSFLIADLEKTRALLRERGIMPGDVAKSADGNEYFAVKEPNRAEIRFVRYLPDSWQMKLRGKAPGDKRVSDHLHHIGMAADKESASMAFYSQALGFREFMRGGPNGEIRWINLKMPATPGDIVELMVMASTSPESRQHIGFETPDIQRTYKQLLDRGMMNRFKPFPGQNPVNRWIMFIRDPNNVRIEFMGEAIAQDKTK
jgi:catechol 2,3-dioxygenase-like lactoylglutathione lyase family enzyme